jgi:hypothetical protein
MKGFVAAFVIATGLAAPAAAQLDAGPLGAAKDLYASARYDEALTVLNGLRGGDAGDRKSVEQYRSLCLLALGRATEAESAIAAVVTADPTYQPGEDASPRVRSSFTEVRRRLLPDIATSRYVSAKAAYDRRDWDVAEQQFRLVLSLIDDPDTGGRLRDLRVLTVGFLELSAKAAAPPPPPPAPAPSPEPKAVPPAAPAAPAGPEPGRIYGSDDAGVLPPVVIKQDIPLVPSAIVALSKPRGLMEINIDELGRVVSMTVRMSIHPAYDSQLLAAARDWRYQPATFNGHPVKFRKLIQIAVKR